MEMTSSNWNLMKSYGETYCQLGVKENKAGNTATQVACGWVGAIFEAIPSFEQKQ